MGDKARVGELKMPKGLSPRAAKEFRRIKRELERLHVLAIDVPALTAYLTHYALWEEAKEQLDLHGAVILTTKGQAQINPWHSIMKQNSELLKKWIQELGFSPGSRKRLAIDMAEKPTDDELFED
jgi:P27 family predicted phage terminase small subunit